MFGHPQPGGGGHESAGGGNVEGAGPVAAGAHDVHQRPAARRAVAGHRGGLGPHHLGRPADLLQALALHAQGDEQGPDLGRGGLALHDLIHGPDHLLLAQIAAAYRLGNGLLNHDCLLLPFNKNQTANPSRESAVVRPGALGAC